MLHLALGQAAQGERVECCACCCEDAVQGSGSREPRFDVEMAGERNPRRTSTRSTASEKLFITFSRGPLGYIHFILTFHCILDVHDDAEARVSMRHNTSMHNRRCKS